MRKLAAAGSTKKSASSTSCRRPRFFGSSGRMFFTLDAKSDQQDDRKRRERVPLERIRLVFFRARLGGGPVAQQTIVERAVLLEHPGFERDAGRCGESPGRHVQ